MAVDVSGHMVDRYRFGGLFASEGYGVVQLGCVANVGCETDSTVRVDGRRH
jgi:hypothetical protein